MNGNTGRKFSGRKLTDPNQLQAAAATVPTSPWPSRPSPSLDLAISSGVMRAGIDFTKLPFRPKSFGQNFLFLHYVHINFIKNYR
jgi:hypothetical protein